MKKLCYTSEDLIEYATVAQNEGRVEDMEDYLNMAVESERWERLEGSGEKRVVKGRMSHLLDSLLMDQKRKS